jgi:mono/diheme cytochrome c family protein
MAKINANWKILLLCLAFAMGTGANATAASSASTLYAKRCAACHGQKGNGDGPTGMLLSPHPQPFSTALKGKSDSWLDTVITHGGPAVGLSAEMPAQPTFNYAQVKDLIQYIKGFGS